MQTTRTESVRHGVGPSTVRLGSVGHVVNYANLGKVERYYAICCVTGETDLMAWVWSMSLWTSPPSIYFSCHKLRLTFT